MSKGILCLLKISIPVFLNFLLFTTIAFTQPLPKDSLIRAEIISFFKLAKRQLRIDRKSLISSHPLKVSSDRIEEIIRNQDEFGFTQNDLLFIEHQNVVYDSLFLSNTYFPKTTFINENFADSIIQSGSAKKLIYRLSFPIFNTRFNRCLVAISSIDNSCSSSRKALFIKKEGRWVIERYFDRRTGLRSRKQ